MKGIDLARLYYEAYGKPMLEREFSDILRYLAVGLVGSGSERFGYDDEVSQDHDFEPGFCIFIPGEDVVDTRTEFRLKRAYDKLPREFMGFKRAIDAPVGGARNGVMRTADFYGERVGSHTGELTTAEWLAIPDSYLAEATNGKIFFDGYGEFTKIRERLLVMPEDVRLKRLAGNIMVMAQSGQYNYSRCLSHGEPEAAQLALNNFVDGAARVFFLLEKKYMPFYKWAFRAMREAGGKNHADRLAALLTGDIYDRAVQAARADAVEGIAKEVIKRLKDQGLTEEDGSDLERHAYAVNDKIRDGGLRNANIFAAV